MAYCNRPIKPTSFSQLTASRTIPRFQSATIVCPRTRRLRNPALISAIFRAVRSNRCRPCGAIKKSCRPTPATVQPLAASKACRPSACRFDYPRRDRCRCRGLNCEGRDHDQRQVAAIDRRRAKRGCGTAIQSDADDSCQLRAIKRTCRRRTFAQPSNTPSLTSLPPIELKARENKPLDRAAEQESLAKNYPTTPAYGTGIQSLPPFTPAAAPQSKEPVRQSSAAGAIQALPPLSMASPTPANSANFANSPTISGAPNSASGLQSLPPFRPAPSAGAAGLGQKPSNDEAPQTPPSGLLQSLPPL